MSLAIGAVNAGGAGEHAVVRPVAGVPVEFGADQVVATSKNVTRQELDEHERREAYNG